MGIKSSTPFDINNYFTIEALEDDLSVVFTNDVEFGIDGIGWQKLLANTNSPTINKGQTISFRANIIPLNFGGIGQFVINKFCNLSGNIMSLLWKGTIASFAFYNLFKNCATIKSADRLVLPATTLANDCYNSMFWCCSNLTTAPKLPATTLASSCYRYMFYNCQYLTTAPELPVTTLADSCYNGMFRGCAHLTTAPELPATTLDSYCYSYMFAGCTNLTTAPELPATTLADDCYSNMFNGCIDLNYIKMLATNISASNCLQYWVNGVARTGTFVKNAAMTTLPTGTSGIPSGWTVVNDGEESIESNLNLVIDYNNLTQNDVDQIINYMIDNGLTANNGIEIELLNDSITVIRKNVEYPISWIKCYNDSDDSNHIKYRIELYVNELYGYPYFWIDVNALRIGLED